MNKSDFVNNIYCSELDTDVKGFFSKRNINVLKTDYTKGTVLQGMEFRPDKLASYYLGDERLGWILDLANDFKNGIKDYYLGREIIIPTRKAIMLLKKE